MMRTHLIFSPDNPNPSVDSLVSRQIHDGSSPTSPVIPNSPHSDTLDDQPSSSLPLHGDSSSTDIDTLDDALSIDLDDASDEGDSSPSSPVYHECYDNFHNYNFSRWSASIGARSSDFSFRFHEVIPTGVGAGLFNLGNTCFMNVILQCFTHTVPFVEGLRSLNHPTPFDCVGDGFCVVCAIHDHIELSLSSSGSVISPITIVDNLNYLSSFFMRNQQEDAHEFLQCLLDKLERCCLDSKSNDKIGNLVKRVFGGHLVSELKCCNCGHCSITHEPLIDLSLEIEDVDSLPSALESFTKVEKIEDPETKFICKNCKEEVSLEKQLMVEQAPSVAVFHFKKFKADGLQVEKIDKHVDFPLELDLQQYTIGSQNNVTLKYSLYAIVVHIGVFSTSGHYLCFIRSSPDTWHELDDSVVTRVQEDFVLSQEAYILFYARQGTPWFSSLIEERKSCETSPKSVLDNTDYIQHPTVGNIDSRDANGLGDAAEQVSAQFACGTTHSGVQADVTRDVAEGITTQFSGGSKQDRVVLDECRSSSSVTENICSTSSLDIEDSNKSLEEALKNKIFHCLTQPMSPSPDNSDEPQEVEQNRILRGHLKLVNKLSYRRTLNKASENEQRREALRFIKNSMSGSMRARMLAAMMWNQIKRKRKKRRIGLL